MKNPKTDAPKTRVTADSITNVSAKIPMPEVTTNRGNKSPYPFDALTEVGMSFGVKNRTKASMASIVSNQNRKHQAEKKDADGNTVFKTKEIKDAQGNVTNVPTKDAETVQTKEFFAMDVDPKSDPDGASVRIWRKV